MEVEKKPAIGSRGLRFKFVFAIAVLYLAIGLFTFLAFRYATAKVVHEFGVNFVKKQSLLTKNKTLSLIRKEVAISSMLVESPVLKLWAENENDERFKSLALQELESYRRSFRDKSFFFIVDKSGDYYFNNSKNEFKDHEFRYVLNPNNINDQWYYRTMKEVNTFALNVDFDNHLNVTKVWINTIVRGKDNQKSGLGGTGFELTDFINETVHSKEEGLSTILVSQDGGIEGHRDSRYMKYNSQLRGAMKKITIYDLMTKDSERSDLREILSRLSANKSEAETLFLDIQKHSYLAGISHIEDIDWFVITLADISKVIKGRNFIPIILVILFSLLGFLLMISVLLNKMVLRPLYSLTSSSRQIASGNYDVRLARTARDELGELTETFNHMAKMIKDNTENLEEKVAQRTEELTAMNTLLDKHARTDPLTGLGNRREILERMEQEISRANRFKRTFSIVLVDLDRFKEINDNNGHGAGDYVLEQVSRKFQALLRSIDTCGRWGGDEFLLILPETPMGGAIVVAENLRAAIQSLDLTVDQRPIQLTLSAGISEYRNGETADECIRQADLELYKAKEQGRNRIAPA